MDNSAHGESAKQMKVVLPLFPRWFRWFGVVVLSGFLFYVSIITVPPDVATDATEGEDVFSLIADIVGFTQAQWRHFLAYGALAYALAYATAHWEYDRWERAFIVIFAAAMYGLSIEIGQYFTPHRFFDINDILANTIGACLVLPWYYLRPRIELYPVTDIVRGISERL